VTQKQNVLSWFNQNIEWQGEFYDVLNDYQSRLLRRRREYVIGILKGLTVPLKGKALDIGCGSGAYLEKLLAMGFEVTGVDISPVMLAASRKRLGIDSNDSNRIHLKLGDIERLPLPDGEFDLVICIGVLGYLFDDEHAQSEIRRVLKPGGYLVLILSNIYSLSNLDFVIRQKLKSFLKLKSQKQNSISFPEYAIEIKWAIEHGRYYYKAYNPWKYERAMTGWGFKLIDAMTFGFEFRLPRKLHLIPSRWLDIIELSLERFIHRFNIPYLPYSGGMYIGVFIRT